jgi:hypothetical protein
MCRMWSPESKGEPLAGVQCPLRGGTGQDVPAIAEGVTRKVFEVWEDLSQTLAQIQVLFRRVPVQGTEQTVNRGPEGGIEGVDSVPQELLQGTHGSGTTRSQPCPERGAVAVPDKVL